MAVDINKLLELARARKAASEKLKSPIRDVGDVEQQGFQNESIRTSIQHTNPDNNLSIRTSDDSIASDSNISLAEDFQLINFEGEGNVSPSFDSSLDSDSSTTGNQGKIITLNDKQLKFNNLVQAGEDCVLIGAAGTGKTTSMRRVTEDLLSSLGRLPRITVATKRLTSGTPGCAILSYTRKAVNNIRHAVVEELKSNTMTIHAILEFEPVFYQIPDPANPGVLKNTMKFEPKRNAFNPLPPELQLLAFEEGSMIPIDLYNLLQDAMPHPHQEIFLGDIQQLPPIFGPAVLGFKMDELEVVELTEVYRQALNSPIISLAWKILDGNPHDFSGRVERYVDPDTKQPRIKAPQLDALSSTSDFGSVKFQVWQKTLTPDKAVNTAIAQFKQWEVSGYYNPEDDIILCPFNKAFGTIELNKGIAGYLGSKRNALVHEVIAGFQKHYLAVGDRVLYDKEDAFITSVELNPNYAAKVQPIAPSIHLDRWGVYQEKLSDQEVLQAKIDAEANAEAGADLLLDELAWEEVEDRVQACSHIVRIRLAYDNEEKTLSQAGDVNALLGGYAITIHKAQGSEWNKVFLVLHSSHAVALKRELLYTGITRAKKELHIICENSTFEKGVKVQAIKGNTLHQKAAYFKGKMKNGDARDLPKPTNSLGTEEKTKFSNKDKVNDQTITSKQQRQEETTKPTELPVVSQEASSENERQKIQDGVESNKSLGRSGSDIKQDAVPSIESGTDQVETARERGLRILAEIRARKQLK